MLAGLCPDDGALQHSETGGRVESGRYWHFDQDVFAGWHALEGNQDSARAHVDGSAKFEGVAALLVGCVYKNGKSQGYALPATGLVLHLSHGLDFLTQALYCRDAAGC